MNAVTWIFGLAALMPLVSAYVMLRGDQKVERESILSQCRLFPTSRLRYACYRIAKNPSNIRMSGNVKAIRRKYDQAQTETTLPTLLKVARSSNSFINNGVGESLECEVETECRENLSLSVRKENLRSTSPWDYCEHVDEYRFPQRINQAACLCNGCIDTSTGLHTFNGVSRPIPVWVSVIYRESYVPSFDLCTNYSCYEQLIKVDVACHCKRPRS